MINNYDFKTNLKFVYFKLAKLATLVVAVNYKNVRKGGLENR